MDYFKHYSTASDSKSLNLIFDRFGHKGIAFWWMFTELCCENWDGHSAPDFVFHPRTVTTKLKSSLNSVRPWLELCSTLGMTEIEISKTQIAVKFPKLAEIKTSRTTIKSNKNQLTVYKNRIEENRIDTTPTPSSSFDPRKFLDAKKILPAEEPQDFRNSKGVKPDALIQRFNDTLAGKGKVKHCRGLSGADIQEFLTTTSYAEFSKIETWDEVFQNAALSPFLLGQERSSWVVTLNWLVKHENALKVLNGAFNGGGDGDLETWALGLKLEA